MKFLPFFSKKNSLLKRLDFIIIWTQKWWTTALDYYLRQHPDIGMWKRKEIHFFDRDKYFQGKEPNYLKYHKDLNIDKKINGEATPIYLYWKASCQRIFNYNSNIKLIAILRNPIDRAYSQWNMEYEKNNEKLDFFDAIKNEQEKLQKNINKQHKIFSYIDRGFYSKQIKRYKKIFPSNQLMFVKFEDFRNNQEIEINNILDFIWADKKKFSYSPKIIHKRKYSRPMNKEERNYLYNLFHEDIQEVEWLLWWNCSDWV